MVRRFTAIFENGVFRPLEPVSELPNLAEVTVSVDSPHFNKTSLLQCIGILSDEDAAEMKAIIAEEFERTDERDWQ